MGYNAYFQRGNYKIMVDGTDVLALAMDFLPPTTDEEIYTSSGTSANVYGGEIRVGQKARNKAWGFGVRALGTSPGKSGLQMDLSLGRLNHFLRGAGDENNPTTFVWYSDNDVTFEPVFGQGFRRVVVVSGHAGWGDGYSIANLRESGVNNCPVTLQIKPYALGRAQVVGIAAGGVYEDTLGYADGISRGVWIPPVSATGGNYFTNPVFGASTWNTGWTAGANLRQEQNTDAAYIAHGVNSARITKTGATATYTQSLTLTVATYCISCYAKKRDGSAITASDIVLYYNSGDVTPTFLALTNGWYRLYGTVTGVASALATGVNVKVLTNSMYVDGFQCERLAYLTPFYYGDMLGCAWASTAHASASTRALAYIYWSQANTGINAAEGTVELIVDAKVILAGAHLWQWYVSGTNEMGLSFADATTLTFNYYNGGDHVTQGTVAAGKLVIHATWSQTGLKVFCNGAQLGSTQADTSFLALTAGVTYLGTDAAGTSQSPVVYRHYAIYDRAMTTAQILARYNHFAPLVTTDKPIMPIPWMWTIGGDLVFDAYCDATHADYGVIGGISGNVPAITSVLFSRNLGVAPVRILLALDTNKNFRPESELFKDFQTSAFAAALNGEFDEYSVTSSDVAFEEGTISTTFGNEYAGKFLYPLITVRDNGGANLTWKVSAAMTGTIISGYTPIAATTTLKYFLLQQMSIPAYAKNIASLLTGFVTTLNIGFTAKRTVAGAANVGLDTARALFGTVMEFVPYTTSLTATNLYEDGKIYYVLATTSWGSALDAVGGKIEFKPGEYNFFSIKLGNGSTWTTADYFTVSSASITPRWRLL